jgi:hypothetical protein
MVLQLVLPDLRAVDVLQVDALASLVSITVRIVEELICKLTKMLQVVLYSQRYVLFCGEVACVLD